MILKAIAHWWASSKLEKEEARAQSLIRELDRAKEAANNRIQARRSKYASNINAHQEKRNKELKTYIDFMNEQLKITAGYLPELNQFQNLTFTCVDSWMHVDLCQQELEIVSQKINTIASTMSLLDVYIFELKKLSQQQGRDAWREFTTARKLTVTNDFVEKTKKRIDSTFKSNHDDFKNELKRVQSHRNALYKKTNELRAERALLQSQKAVYQQQHKANQKALAEKYKSCGEHWDQIKKKFECYYAHKPSENKQVDDWLANFKDGGTLPEIREAIGIATEIINRASEDLSKLNDEYQPYKLRATKGGEPEENYAKRKSLQPKLREAFENKKSLSEARGILYARRNELKGYIDRIKPLHPDAAIDSMCEILNADREFNSRLALGINTSKQKREHWEKKQKRIENAIAN